MSSRFLVAVTFSLSLFSSFVSAAEPVRLILDSDMGNDIDDALALGMIHALESRSEVRLIAVTITKDNRWAAPYVDLVNTYYGRPNIPLGVVRDGKTKEDSPYLIQTSQKRASNSYIYPHRVEDGSKLPDAVAVLEKVLSEQPDHSVTIAQIGFSTNLARLLKRPGGRELIEKKVKLLSLMAGNFSKPEPEYNVFNDGESAKFVFANWPTPMVFSGFEVGLLVKFNYADILRDFNYTDNHPVAEAYKIYAKPKEDRPNWDSTAVLYAIRPDRGYFELSEPGNVSLGAKDVTTFTPDPKGKCRYLILKPERASRVEATIETLVSQPPDRSAKIEASKRTTF